MIQFILQIKFSKEYPKPLFSFIQKPVFTHHLEKANTQLYLWGDPILSNDFESVFKEELPAEKLINTIAGHFYFLFIKKNGNEIVMGNSLFGILPVYYTLIGKELFLSNNALSLAKQVGKSNLSKRSVVESVLFNFPLFDHSPVEGIKILASNSLFSVGINRWSIIKHTHIENYFPDNPRPWRKTLDDTRDVFFEVVKKYLPETLYINALTGGFDGRTLVSAGLFHNRKFSCYSFGSDDSNDTLIPTNLCKSANLNYIKLRLGEDYVQEESLSNGLEFIRNGSGIPTFARAHYLYAAKILKEKTDIMVTGNLGSEIFRAAHNPGVIFSRNLIALFRASNPEESFHFIENSREFEYLNKLNLIEKWMELKNDLMNLPCFNPQFKEFTQNQKFYVFVFEEIFRKYFGTEMVNQFMYIKNRTPFLDLDFLKAIFNTELAGIHSGFFEHNPFKRYKGQVLYAHIIKNGYPPFGKMMTDKGYRPDDLLTVSGKLRIVHGYLNKRINKPKPNYDPYRVKQAYEYNSEFYKQLPIDYNLFDKKMLEENSNNKPDETLYKIISLSYLKSLLK